MYKIKIDHQNFLRTYSLVCSVVTTWKVVAVVMTLSLSKHEEINFDDTHKAIRNSYKKFFVRILCVALSHRIDLQYHD